MSRRHRRAKTDRIDGETLIRALIAWKRGEPRACSMVKLLTPEEDDNRRLGRERKLLIAERVFHVIRIKGQLFTQGSESSSLCVAIAVSTRTSFELETAVCYQST